MASTHRIGTRPDCKPFTFSYRHDGGEWSVTLFCYDWADAEARAKLLNLRLDGELMEVIHVNELTSRPVSLFIRAYCWFRNLLR
jgi:hypothetical protein